MGYTCNKRYDYPRQGKAKPQSKKEDIGAYLSLLDNIKDQETLTTNKVALND